MKVKIEKQIFGGWGKGRLPSGKVVFVPFTDAGEEVEIEVVREKKSYAFADLKKIIVSSPYRIEPRCRLFGLCGGCHYQHLAYQRQVEIKRDILQEILKIKPDHVISTSPFGYRNRLKIFSSGFVFGLKNPQGRVVDVENCPVACSHINQFLSSFRNFYSLNFYALFPDGRGFDELSVRASFNGKLGVRIVSFNGFNYEPILAAFPDVFPGVSLLEIKSGGERIYKGKRFLRERLKNFKFRLTNSTFFQVNREGAEKMLDLVLETVRELSPARVIDAYCGVGTFSIPIASLGIEVVGIEANKASWLVAKRNARLNGVSEKVRFFRGDVSESLAQFLPSELVIVDPPREGLAKEVVKFLNSAPPRFLIYISCNPPTLARDISRLESFEVERVVMVDMFPQTFHIEVFTLLRSKV